jgi:hypothetical protein
MGKASRAQARAAARKELEKMSEVMTAERGLLNHPQAALVLGVSVKRIGELVRLGKLSRFDFLGRTYVSMAEVCKRDDEEIAAGARKRSKATRLVAGVKAALKTDGAQIQLGGFQGSYVKAEQKKRMNK